MDALYFLKSRTGFVRFFYTERAKAFVDVKHRIENELPPFDNPRIENELPPFDNPPYSEDPEPAYLEEWMDAERRYLSWGLPVSRCFRTR